LSTRFRLVLPRQLYDDMIAQARSELPNECCGLLAGRIVEPANQGGQPLGLIVQRYPLINEAASRTEYLSKPESMFAAERDRRKQGLEFLAVYHSHPTSQPVPSRKDRERNYSTEMMNLIISLQAPVPLVRAWWLTAESCGEADWEVTS
jgi:[CysO sulfur-carrier protein]-S-L-cysteine hydrolase